MYRRNPEKQNEKDRRRADVRLVSNPELLQYDDDLYFLPNPVPVRRYARMRELLYKFSDTLRVGHSPTKRHLKGTKQLLEVVDKLKKDGYNIDTVLIENETHEDSLKIKAEKCDVFFDSFWLGAQCSGLEAGAMGMPVIAGDKNVQKYFNNDTPYIFANDKKELRETLIRLYEDKDYFYGEAGKFYDYVIEHHDYASVVFRYLDILDNELGWRDKLRIGKDTSFLRKN